MSAECDRTHASRLRNARPPCAVRSLNFARVYLFHCKTARLKSRLPRDESQNGLWLGPYWRYFYSPSIFSDALIFFLGNLLFSTLIEYRESSAWDRIANCSAINVSARSANDSSRNRFRPLSTISTISTCGCVRDTDSLFLYFSYYLPNMRRIHHVTLSLLLSISDYTISSKCILLVWLNFIPFQWSEKSV